MENSEITIYEEIGPETKNSSKQPLYVGGEVVKKDYMKRDKIEVAFCEIDARLL